MASAENPHHHSHHAGGEKSEEVHEDTSIVSHTTTRRVMKHLMDTKTVSIEAVACLSKATEVFMLNFVSSVLRNVESSQGTLEIKYEDVAKTVSFDPMCEFLAEIIPAIPSKHGKHHNHHHSSSSGSAAHHASSLASSASSSATSLTGSAAGATGPPSKKQRNIK